MRNLVTVAGVHTHTHTHTHTDSLNNIIARNSKTFCVPKIRNLYYNQVPQLDMV